MARVLVVDDAAFMRKMLGDALSKGGHDVIGEADERPRGRRPLLRSSSPTSPRSTSRCPRRTASTALREILALDPAARVVMCSALGQESKVLESIKSGAKDFVVKPFQPERVLDAVGRALV